MSILDPDFPDAVEQAAQASRRRLVSMIVAYWDATVKPLLGPVSDDEILMMRSSYVRKVLNNEEALAWVQERVREKL